MTARTAPLTAIAAASLLTVAPSYAGVEDIDVVGVLTEESNTFVENLLRGGTPQNFVRSDASIEVASLGTFTQDFATNGDSRLNVRWEAPAGHYIEIVVPEGFGGTEFTFDFFAGNDFGGVGEQFTFGPPTVDYLPGSDTFSFTNDQIFVTGDTGDGARALADVINPAAGGVYRFTSVTLSLPIPPEYDVAFASPISTFSLAGFSTFSGDPGEPIPADPGQWIRLRSLDEPTLYRVDIAGTVSGFQGIGDPQQVLGSEFALGEPLTMAIIYNGDTPRTGGAANGSLYNDAVIGMRGVVGDYEFGIDYDGFINRMELVNGLANGDNVDIFVSHDGDDVNGATASGFFLSLIDPTDAAFPGGFNAPGGPSLPPGLTTPIPFELFTQVNTAVLSFFPPLPPADQTVRGGGEVALAFTIESITERLVTEDVLYRLDMDGQVTGFNTTNAQSILAAEFAVGEAVDLSITYNGSTPADAGTAGNVSEYTGSIVGMEGTIDDYDIALGTSGLNLLRQINSQSADNARVFIPRDGAGVNGAVPAQLFLNLTDTDDELYPPSPNAPPALELPLDFNLFEQRSGSLDFNFFRGGGGGVSVLFSVDAIEPTLLIDLDLPAAPLCPADFDGDGDVDLGDFGFFGSAFGSSAGDINYNPAADFNQNGTIDLGDFGFFGSQFGNGPEECAP